MKDEGRYRARWANSKEKDRDNQHNGVVEEYLPYPSMMWSHVCYVSPMERAKKIAALLNACEHMTVKQVEHLGKALTT